MGRKNTYSDQSASTQPIIDLERRIPQESTKSPTAEAGNISSIVLGNMDRSLDIPTKIPNDINRQTHARMRCKALSTEFWFAGYRRIKYLLHPKEDGAPPFGEAASDGFPLPEFT